MLTVQSEIWSLLKKLSTDFDEIFRIQGTTDQIWGVIWITMLTLQISNMGVMSYLGQEYLCSLSALVAI